MTGLFQPSALTFDAAGHLWVANLANSSPTQYPAGRFGDVQPLATVQGNLTGLNAPERATFDAAGNLLVSNLFSASLSECPVTATGNASPTQARRVLGSPAVVTTASATYVARDCVAWPGGNDDPAALERRYRAVAGVGRR